MEMAEAVRCMVPNSVGRSLGTPMASIIATMGWCVVFAQPGALLSTRSGSYIVIIGLLQLHVVQFVLLMSYKTSYTRMWRNGRRGSFKSSCSFEDQGSFDGGQRPAVSGVACGQTRFM